MRVSYRNEEQMSVEEAIKHKLGCRGDSILAVLIESLARNGSLKSVDVAEMLGYGYAVWVD